MQYYEEALQSDPNSVTSQHNLAVALYALGRKKDCLVYLERALCGSPNDPMLKERVETVQGDLLANSD